MVLLENQIKKHLYQSIIASCQKAAPASLCRSSENKAVGVFNRHAATNSLYRKILENEGFHGHKITDIDAFKTHVPVIDKNKLFHPLNNIDTRDLLGDVRSILLSSGSSGTFSFGLATAPEINASARFLEVLLNHFYHTLEEKTLIINCLSVKLPALNLAAAEIGPRSDSLLYILNTLAPRFSQTIIIGDNYFIKNALEEYSSHKNSPASSLRIHLILGGVYLPENLRGHLYHLLHIDENDPQTGSILSSMGISEFGLNLFFESPETARLRRLAQNEPTLRENLLDSTCPPYLPMFFNYFPQAYFMEELEQKIVITSLNPKSQLPLVRYNTQDTGKLLAYEDLKEKLEGFKDQDRNDLLPPFKSPLVLMYGKAEGLNINGAIIYPQLIQEGIYQDFEAASQTTGNFRLSANDGQADIKIQLKKGLPINEALINKFQKTALRYLHKDISVTLSPYQDFPYGMELDYERKFKYV
ncbi:MAG TPA: hypothetical protein DD723_08935 [Candidatus Omnitrophica bacterium]|nr:MAG: hypothetical protein A2Z81_08535 [Omnitrophica WOR_2 bacterium GWA2_45_18]OGX19354.1 MAG: hypothetical protein A2Y04_01940 [Omnitrophica WOR_2 bacterium GWC2_45_7]HBR15641.1 hypothetical protein [Candidatus Omnitrophota bacterium]